MHAHIYTFLFSFLLCLSPKFFRFEFPNTINLAEFCAPGVDQEQDYTLYSIVAHRGGAGGGHYFTNALDVYGEGKWTAPGHEDRYFKLGDDYLGHLLVQLINLDIIKLQDLVRVAKSNFPEITQVCNLLHSKLSTCIFVLFLM